MEGKKRPSQRRTCVVKKRVHNGAVLERGPHRGDIFKVAVEERGIDERDRLELHTDEPGETGDGGGRCERHQLTASSSLSCRL